MASPPLLLLAGLRCSGKTTLGAAVAARLGVAFQDLDTLVLARLEARSVTEAWQVHGEAGWRQAEAEALAAHITSGTSGVLSLGGGTPTAPGAAACIRSAQAMGHATLALLDPGEDELARRLHAGRGDRPKLGADAAEEVARLRAGRLPLYRSMADALIDTRLPESDCVTRLAELLSRGRWPWPSTPASESPRVRSRRGP